MADIDWASWSKTRPFTIDALSIFNSIDADPFTALVAGAICQQFKFAPRGDHNLADAFGALQDAQGNRAVFGLGYTPRHVVPLLLRTDEGSTFLAVCGTLCEYYPVDTVTVFFMTLAESAQFPRDMRPAESQWRRLIGACAGVLATSTFGTAISRYAEICEATITKDPRQLVEWMLSLNERKTQTISGDGPFLAAISEWLFGVPFAIQTEKGRIGEADAKLTIKSTASTLPTAGRVHWDIVFRTCFGQAWKEVDKDSLTAVIASASGMAHSSLLESGRDPRTFFLHHEVGISSLAGHGVNETIMAWFEELRRIAHGIPRFYREHAVDGTVKPQFDIRMQALEAACKCASCGDGSAAICKVSMAQVIIGLGLYVARMVVIPNLYMKVNGIQEFYRAMHRDRVKRQEMHASYSEWFIKGLTTDLPTPLKMLEVACVLFTGSYPGQLPENCLSINIDGLYLIITFLRIDEKAAIENRPDASVQVHTGGFSYKGRFLQGNAYDPGVSNVSLRESFDNIRKHPKEYRQLVKLQDQTTLISSIPQGEEWEKKAEEQGWDVVYPNR